MSFLIPGSFGEPVISVFTESRVLNVNAVGVTYTAVDLGDAAENRRIVVALGWSGWSSGSVGAGTPFVTVAGVTARVAVHTGFAVGTPNTSLSGATIAIAHVPTGTSGNIAFSYPNAGTPNALATPKFMSAFAVYGLDSDVEYDTAPSSPDPFSVSLDVPSNGLAVGVAYIASGSGDITWTGLTEVDQQSVSVNAASFAHGVFSNESTLSITAQRAAGDGTSTSRFAAASWAPAQ